MSEPWPFISTDSVLQRVPLSPTTIWRLEKAGRFPKRVKITSRLVGYRETEIDEWIKDPPSWRSREAA